MMTDEAYNRGWNAAKSGRARTANPYDFRTPKKDWDRGWVAGSDDSERHEAAQNALEGHDDD